MWLLRLQFRTTEWLRFTLWVGLVGMILTLVERKLLLLMLHRLPRTLRNTRPMGLPGVLPLLLLNPMGWLFMTMLRTLVLMVLPVGPDTRLSERRTSRLETAKIGLLVPLLTPTLMAALLPP